MSEEPIRKTIPFYIAAAAIVGALVIGIIVAELFITKTLFGIGTEMKEKVSQEKKPHDNYTCGNANICISRLPADMVVDPSVGSFAHVPGWSTGVMWVVSVEEFRGNASMVFNLGFDNNASSFFEIDNIEMASVPVGMDAYEDQEKLQWQTLQTGAIDHRFDFQSEADIAVKIDVKRTMEAPRGAEGEVTIAMWARDGPLKVLTSDRVGIWSECSTWLSGAYACDGDNNE